MTHKSIHKGIEFISEEEHQSDLHAWYDNLPDGEVKTSIIRVKCREYQPYDQASFRLIVLCDHPFSFLTYDSPTGSPPNNDGSTDRHLDALVPAFADWIDRHGMPEEVMLGNRYAFADWWPKEMLPHILNDLSPHDQAQREMDNHLLDCLELIRLATLPDQEFAELWQNSNEPFFAAGRMVLGDFQWICEVPLDHFRSEANVEALLDRIGEYSREYVGLMRLASLAGAESPLLDRILSVIRGFNVKHTSEIARWQAQASELLDEGNGMLRNPATVPPAQYEEIDVVCDQLRQNLVEATRDQQDEIPIIINAVLPTLEAPQSSGLFTEKNEHSP